jgi:hypothetical protein
MHYGEMPRATLGSSDLRSQLAIFGEWNIYGTRKKYFVNIQTSNAYLKKNVQLTKSWKTKKTNCPKFIDIQWNTRRNRVGRLHLVHDVTLFCRSFTNVRLVCFVSHSNDMTKWLSNLAENISCNVVTSYLLWTPQWHVTFGHCGRCATSGCACAHPREPRRGQVTLGHIR